MAVEYKIENIDYFENDAILVIGGQRIYFQFTHSPTLAEALSWLFHDGQTRFMSK